METGTARRRVLRLGRVVGAFTLCAVMAPIVAFGVRAFVDGEQLQHVRSGSMEPFLPVGALAVIEPVDPASVEVGQVLTFVDPADRRRIVTHRVAEVRHDQDGIRITTKGDANRGLDPLPVRARDVRGHLVAQVPHVGRVLDILQSRWAPVLLVGLPALALLATEGLAWRRRRHWASACSRCRRAHGPVAAST